MKKEKNYFKLDSPTGENVAKEKESEKKNEKADGTISELYY